MKTNEEHEHEELSETLTKSDLEQLESGRVNRNVQAYALLGGAAVVILLIIYSFYNRFTSENKQKEEKVIEKEVKEKSFALPETTIKKIFKKEEPKAELKPYLPPVTNNIPIPSFKPLIIKGASKALAVSADTQVTMPQINQNTISDNEFNAQKLKNDSFVGDTFTPTRAMVSNFNPDLLLSKGTYIGCSLNTRLVSDIKGGISCTVSDNVYSVNGKVLLVERGSRITGFFKSGQMNDGLNRIFVIWQEIRTPNNLVIPVYSGASDELGGSGIHGYVDHKFLLRFGSAIMLSAIDDVLNIISNDINNNSDENYIDRTENTRENAKDMASIALENFINIKPTLYRNHGELVGVYVNRDIDFSKVYKLTASAKIYK